MMPFDPDLDEMQTTTQRNRSFPPKKKAKKAPVFANKTSHMEKYGNYENTAEDEMEDKRGAKRLGMTPEEYEGTPEDEAEDRRGMSKMNKSPSKASPKESSKGGEHKGVHIAIMVAPMANPPAEHRASVRNSINKAVQTVKRKGSNSY